MLIVVDGCAITDSWIRHFQFNGPSQASLSFPRPRFSPSRSHRHFRPRLPRRLMKHFGVVVSNVCERLGGVEICSLSALSFPCQRLQCFFWSRLFPRLPWIIYGLNIYQWPISTSPGVPGEISGDERTRTSKGTALKPDEVPGLIVPVALHRLKFLAALHPPREILQGLGSPCRPCALLRNCLFHPEPTGFLRKRWSLLLF